MAVDMPRGAVRAYDARTGELRWTWDPIPWAEKQQVRTGAANAWSTFAADPARDMVFIPNRQRQPRLLRRNAARGQSLGQFRGGAQGFHRRVPVGISSSASRSMGLRCRLATRADRVPWKTGGSGDHQDRQCLRAGSHYRQAASHRGGAGGPQERYSRRRRCAQPADSSLERDGSAKTDRGRRLGFQRRSAQMVPRENRIAAQRRPFHSAQRCRAAFRFRATSAA